ncbi:MAG: exodeoxyribonuclease VII large subunit [Lachnospiraceae bacterium]|jgi:exodeoxyribonuclease VII large subunit|nr:exodeoxyribonuclease VII large subunit [Lachnospiraceae bacterium]
MANIYSVTQVNSYIKNMFTQDFMLNRIFIKGEVSNCKYHTSGHVYFTIKDNTSQMACVMFAGNRRGMNFQLKEGQNVVIEGNIDIYERDGKYQLYARKITLDGTGVLYQQYEALKKKLEEMGMFAAEYKRPIPKYVNKVGIVTAQTGAAIRDIVNIATRRNPYVQLILYPALVQGEGAKDSIVKGIQVLDSMNLDVLIVGRGGGSIEDLWAFNEEIVARAIFECRTPVISAVGHEVDVTIADYVADLRAPTPSAAAELAVYDYRALKEQLVQKQWNLKRELQKTIKRYRTQTKQYEIYISHKNPKVQVQKQRQHTIELEEKMEIALKRKIEKSRYRLSVYAERLEGLSPLKRLGNGYAYLSDETGEAIRSIGQLKKGDTFQVQLKDGKALAAVTKKFRKKQEKV